MREAGESCRRQEELTEALIAGPRSGLDAADRAMLLYAEKLNGDPGEMVEGDVLALRSAGFDDRGIHDICAIVAYYAFVNRIADGLGVELEPGEEEEGE